MAKKYHPLDVRYTGPSTAYTGTTKAPRRVLGQPARVPDVPDIPPPPPPQTARAQPSAPPPKAGPWDQRPLPDPRVAPPPLPRAQAKPRSESQAFTRVMIVLVVIGLIVGLNIFISRSVGNLSLHVNDALQTEMEALDL